MQVKLPEGDREGTTPPRGELGLLAQRNAAKLSKYPRRVFLDHFCPKNGSDQFNLVVRRILRTRQRLSAPFERRRISAYSAK
jgi:hypothetical protein